MGESVTVQEEQRSLSVVVLGAFNPAIFQPAWFAAEELLPAGEAKAAEIEVVHPDIAIFTAEWLHVEVTRERLALSTRRESHFEALRDLATGTLMLLRHTPTRVCGVNHGVLLSFPDRTSFDSLGWRIVPRENWDPVLSRPGVAVLDELGQRPDDREGYVRVRVEAIPDATYRARLEINDHFVFSNESSPESTERITSVLIEEWAAIEDRAKAIMAHVKELIV